MSETSGEPRGEEGPSDEQGRAARLAKILVPLLLLGLGVFAFVALVLTRPTPEKEAPTERVLAVDVVTALPGEVRSLVEARGQVQAAERVELEPDIAGRIVWVSPDLVPGGRFRRGQRLLRIDPTDFRLAVDAQRGEVSQAEVQLRQEQNRQEVSERAWERYQARRKTTREVDSALARNLPQVEAAKRRLESARSRLRQAEVDLARTSLEAPFDASVVEGRVDVGRRVSPGQPIATLVGTDHYWVNVSVEVDDLQLLRVPGERGEESGSAVRVVYASRGGRTERSGRVLRLIKELDQDGSMAQVLVEVDDPLGLEVTGSSGEGLEPEERGPPLLIGAFVDVTIQGQFLDDVFVLPEEVVREGNTVWIVDDEDRLQRRSIGVLRYQRGSVIVAEGLTPGDRVVRSALPLAVPGTKVVPQEPRAQGEPAGPAPRTIPASAP